MKYEMGAIANWLFCPEDGERVHYASGELVCSACRRRFSFGAKRTDLADEVLAEGKVLDRDTVCHEPLPRRGFEAIGELSQRFRRELICVFRHDGRDNVFNRKLHQCRNQDTVVRNVAS